MKSKQKQDKEQFFVELFNSCKDAMYRRAYRIVQNHADAQDVVKNAVAHLWEVRDKLPEDAIKLYSYAIVSTHYAAIDPYNRNKRYLELYSNIMEDIVVMGQQCGVNPFNYIAAMENTEEILCCLRKINEDYCEIIMLAYYLDLSMKEVANLLGTSESVARIKLFRARRALEKELARLGYGGEKKNEQKLRQNSSELPP